MTNKIILSFSKIILGLSLAIVLLPFNAQAMDAAGIGAAPSKSSTWQRIKDSWFVYEVDPATKIEDSIDVNNNSDEIQKIKLEALDGLLTSDGSFTLKGSASQNEDLGTWIKLETDEIVVPPKSKKVVKFIIDVPANADVGDHVGGITVEKISDKPDTVMQSGGTKVFVTSRTGARMYLTVKGDIKRGIALKKRAWFANGSKMYFRFQWQNTGNVRAELVANTKIYGVFGLYDKIDNFNLGQILAKKTLTTNMVWPGKDRPIFGPFVAKMIIEDTFKGLNPTENSMPPVAPMTVWLFTFFIPYLQTAILVGLLFIAWFINKALAWQKLAKLSRMPVVEYMIKNNEHLTDIAQRFDINWKLLATLNDIKAPYSLHGIKTIYVPDARGNQREDKYLPTFFTFILRPIAKFLPKPKQKPTFYVINIDEDDTIKDIEEFTGLTWREIAKFNKIKPTAKLKVGQELKVPETKT